MSDAPLSLPRRRSVFDRIRGALILLFLCIGAFALYYSLFFERKTTYLSSRNARLIALLGEQIRRSIDITGRIVANATVMKNAELEDLYKFNRGLTTQRPAQAIFEELKVVDDAEKTLPPRGHNFAERRGDTLRITFERGDAYAARSKFDLAEEIKPKEAAEEQKQKSADPKPFARGIVELRRLVDPMVRQAATGVFDTVFILDHSGDVIYQWTRQSADDSDAELKIVRLNELQVPRLFDGEQTLRASDLMSASRQMAVRIGDRKYQLVSVPIRSGVHIEAEAHPDATKAEAKPEPTDKEKAEQKASAGFPPDMWVVCGAVSNAEFRSRSLAISATLLCCLGAAVLLMICSWPFLKMALSSAQQKITLVDGILLGLSGVMAMSMVALIVLDTFTYRKLEAIADKQLEEFSKEIEANLDDEIFVTLGNLDHAQRWAEKSITAGPVEPTRNANLLKSGSSFRPIEKPFFQSFALLGKEGTDDRQRLKWSVDKSATPLISVASRVYYFAALHQGRDYLTFGKSSPRRLAIESVRSITTGQPEVVFSRRTLDNGENPPRPSDLRNALPVIAMSSSAISIIDPVVPEGFGFAIVDESGRVLFHSLSVRNTVENFFAETDEDPRVRSAVAARQVETMNIRYLGEDYTAHVRPMNQLPWTIITFREKQGLRMLNTEVLLITLICIFTLALATLFFIALVLLLRPRYRAAWLWPDPKRVGSYAELAAAYFFLLAAALVLLLTLHGSALLLFPFPFIPLVLAVTYLYLRPKLRGVKWISVVAVDVISVALLIVQMWTTPGHAAMPALAASLLLAIVGVRAIVRPLDSSEPARERQTALPLCYVWAAFLLLLLASVVPTTAFFKAAYEMEIDSYVKWVQMKLAGDLQQRWWRVQAEYSNDRGEGKGDYRTVRWNDKSDIYSRGVFDTDVNFPRQLPDQESGGAGPVFPEFLEPILPHYSEASVNTRELVHDHAADDMWWWERKDGRLNLLMKNRVSEKPFAISSLVPQLFPSMSSMNPAAPRDPAPVALVALVILAMCGVAFAIARFIARRIFLVDLVHPLALSRGYIGLRNVICHPCDDDSARRLFAEFRRIDVATDEGLAIARIAPQSFDTFETAVFIDGVDYSFAGGERSEILRALIDRLTRNSDRTVVIRPTALTVITRSCLQGEDRAKWSETLAPFVWVNWSQMITTAKTITLSGPMAAFVDDTPEKKKWSWRDLYALAGFDTYFEQFTDTRGTIKRTLKAETDGDPYLETMVTGLAANATGRDQVLDEIAERAEEYYAALWYTCSPHEQLVLMQLAQTGLVNFKTRKHVRRLLARGHIRRDPQLRIMNETFRRYVLAQCATSTLAEELETNLAGDAWSRFRVPLFASVAIVLLFFFVTQRQMFDSTIALVTGLAASLPAFVNMVSRFGDRGAKA